MISWKTNSKNDFEPAEKSKMAVKILPDELIYPDTTAIWEKMLEEKRLFLGL